MPHAPRGWPAGHRPASARPPGAPAPGLGAGKELRRPGTSPSHWGWGWAVRAARARGCLHPPTCCGERVQGGGRGAAPGAARGGAGLAPQRPGAGPGPGAGPPLLPPLLPRTPGPGLATREPAPRGLAATLSWERRHHEEVVLRWAPRPERGGVGVPGPALPT